MKELPDEQKMLEMLEVFKESEEKAKEMCEFATAMALKYQRKIREISPANSRQVSGVE
ncbi:hypothetical protein PMG71_21680 [Roseofilum sp. BLCC_M154]|uniref:Uncharacterized protein n=1 Tax=Roseofilum acuticapitatum BLCC-M154 TaxID=3022444 RepID=A0ABT7AYT4_9CYAN|nr:hypothetical protein [Roseofilum acuticapitatum]MDJ1172046.1 hypothetical protein [Roseofilum acuticapitatum BLCC-M154]